MPAWLAQSEPYVRLGVFGALFATFALWEVLAPRRAPALPRRRRWSTNLGLFAVDVLVLRLLFPLAGVGIALLVEARGYGVLNALGWPAWVEVVLAFLALDLLIYFQHRLFHAVPVLWRLHKVHHADLGFDLTTGVRFHPVEIVLSMLIKFAAIAALGAPVLAVLAFEIALTGTALFNHANIRLAAGVDRRLRWLVVTPDMHRVHHSTYVAETNSNYGFNIPWWDRLFGTYRPQPKDGHTDMRIGLSSIREHTGLGGLLVLPLQPRGQQVATRHD